MSALGAVYNTVSQSVMLLSGMLLPLTLAPMWIVSVARLNRPCRLPRRLGQPPHHPWRRRGRCDLFARSIR